MRTPCPVFIISKLSRSAGYRTFRFGNRFDDTFSTLGTFEDKEILVMMLFEFTISIGLCRCPVLQFGSGDGDGDGDGDGEGDVGGNVVVVSFSSFDSSSLSSFDSTSFDSSSF